MHIGGRLLAAIILVLAAPMIALLASVTLIAMGRPVLFHQRRSGLGGKTFTMAKFRSMRDAFGPDGQPLPDEDRVSAWGKFLRRSRLDELPGLLSIISGDMAFVGPRPLLPETIAKLGDRGKARGEVRPGLTGWAQVNGNTLLSLDEKIALDLHYVRHAGIGMDLAIIVRTLWVMIGGERRTKAANETETGLTRHH